MPNDASRNASNAAGNPDRPRRRRAAASTRDDTPDHTPHHTRLVGSADARAARLEPVTNRRALLLSPLYFVVALLTLAGLGTSPAAANAGPETRVRAFDTPVETSVAATSSETPASIGRLRPETVATAVGSCVATEAVDIAGANFAQTTASRTFSSGGTFAGQSIDDVAGALRSGAMSAKDVPVQVIVRDGNTLILNTRSALALEQAGVPRSAWNVVNVTGDPAAQARLAGQLARNGLDSTGTSSVRITGAG